MADLVTHTCAALLPALLVRWRWSGVLALGAALPDLGGRVLPLGLDALEQRGAPVPEWALWPWPILHEPVGALLVSALVATTFVAGQRRAAFGVLALGVASHLLLDVLQDHHGRGYLLLAPLSTRRFELGWIDSEATVAVAPTLLVATLGVAAWRAWRR